MVKKPSLRFREDCQSREESDFTLSHFERDARVFWVAALSVSQTAADLLAFSPQPSRGFTVSPKMRKYPMSCVRCVEQKVLLIIAGLYLSFWEL